MGAINARIMCHAAFVPESPAAPLTIGIPTYNRRDALVRAIESIQGIVPVLVVDDGSSDGTSEAVEGFDGVRVVRHDSNLGYANAFHRLLSECRTDFLLITTDDDLVVPSQVEDLQRWLARVRPAFVSTTWVDGGGGTSRGHKSRRIEHREFIDAAKHAPGLVYHIPRARPALDLLRQFIDEQEAAAYVYPQVVMLALLLSGRGRCHWSEFAPVVEGARLETGITLPSGQPYTSFEAVMEIRRSFFRVLYQLPNSRRLRRANARKLLIQTRHHVPSDLHRELQDAYAQKILEQLPKRLWKSIRRIVGDKRRNLLKACSRRELP